MTVTTLVKQSQLPLPALCKTIRALTAKGDQAIDKATDFYIAAGIHLAELKTRKPAGTPWPEFVKANCGLGQQRADELIRIGDGRTTVEKVRADTASRVKDHRSMLRNIDFHPMANIFPLIEGEEFDSFVASIKQYGLICPITLYQGAILDGRIRFLACERANVKPRFDDYEGDDPLAFVLGKNLYRTHLNESQRAMVAARFSDVAAP